MAKRGAKKTDKQAAEIPAALRKIVHPKKRAYLTAYAVTGSHAKSIAAAECCRNSHYFWLEHDPDYVVAFEVAKEVWLDIAEEEAWRRATQGVRRLKFDKNGETLTDPETGQPYEELSYSDTLMIFMLKAGRPEKYRERYEAMIGGNGKPIEHDHTHRLDADAARSRLAPVFERFGLKRLAHGDEPPATNGNGKTRRGTTGETNGNSAD